MTRKDYIAFAQAFKKLKACDYAKNHRPYEQGIEDCIYAVCKVLRADNPRFNQTTFDEACEPDAVEAFTKSLNV